MTYVEIYNERVKDLLNQDSKQALLPTATYCYLLLPTATHCYPLLPTATNCYPLLPTATHCYPLLLQDLEVREDARKGTHIQGAVEITVNSLQVNMG